MAHPNVINHSRMNMSSVFVTDESGQPVATFLVKGTFAIGSNGLTLSEKQLEFFHSGILNTDGEVSSYKYEPESAFTKVTSDIVLIGHACPRRPSDRHVDVTFRVGNLEKTVRVFGDRVWEKHLGTVSMSPPAPFEKIPLIYERAFGGWDSDPPDVTHGNFEPRNPVGVGFKRRAFVDGMCLPNIESPNCLLKSYGDTPPPAGFGFVSPNWQPRLALAGTYDEAWERERSPFLPTDFDRRFFNAASEGLVAPTYLRGNELIEIVGVGPVGRLQFQLPALAPPPIRVAFRDAARDLQPELDTLIVNTDDMVVICVWRTYVLLKNGPLDIREITVGAPPSK